MQGVGAKQAIHQFLGGKATVIQQGTSVWVGLPSPPMQGGHGPGGSTLDTIRNYIMLILSYQQMQLDKLGVKHCQ